MRDQYRSREFYKEVLGKEPELDVPGMTEFALSSSALLGIMPESGIARILGNSVPHPETGSGIPRCEIYLFVENPALCYERLLLAGGKGIEAPFLRPWGDVVAYGVDPDGHVVAFARTHQSVTG